MRTYLSTKSTHSVRFIAALLALLWASVWSVSYGGMAASAQQGQNIYAAATLTAAGSNSENTSASATFEHSVSGSTRVTLVIIGLAPSSSLASQIRDGSCSGAVLYQLSALQADASGMARAVTDLPVSVDFGRWYVRVDTGAAGQGTGSLCGSVNPALAAPPDSLPGGGTAPGMPATGQPADVVLTMIIALTGAVLSLITGGYLRSQGKRSQSKGNI